MPSFRTCPKCNDRLDQDARQCVCGWTAESKKSGGLQWNHVCRWQFGPLQCRNPVGLFAHGETSGLCVFHRATDRGPAAAEIARESEIHDRESYNFAAMRQVYGHMDNPVVARMRERMEATPNRRKGGSFGNLEEWVELCRQRGTQREAA